MAQINQTHFKSENRIAVENREVFNKESNFVTNLADSAIQQLVITVTAVSESALAQGSAVLPAHSIIHELEAVCTTAFELDATSLFALNVGSASLGATGGAVANIFSGTGANNLNALMGSTAAAIAVGDGFSTRGKVSAALGSTKTGSFASTVKGNHFYTSDQTIFAQLSSSAAAKRFKDDAGTLKVSILYSKVL